MSKDRIDVDADLWSKQKKEIKTARTVGAFSAFIGVLGFSYGLVMTHVPKVITLPPKVETIEVVKYKEYKGLDPDYMAQAIKAFKESHMDSSGDYGCGDIPNSKAPEYEKKYPLNVRIEVRRRLGYLDDLE